MKLPPRRIIRSIVAHAIDDRREMAEGRVDPEAAPSDVEREAADAVREYQELMVRLEDRAPASSPGDISLIRRACIHARIWREGSLDAWADTGSKGVIRQKREAVARIDGVERALGVTKPFIVGGPDPEGMVDVSLSELMRRAA